MLHPEPPPLYKSEWRFRLYQIIYENNTKAGKLFDIVLLFAIFASTLIVMLDSVASWHAKYGESAFLATWGFTILFSIEYTLRLVVIKHPWRFVLSPLGFIDLLAILPSFLSIFFIGSQSLMVFRSLRLLRVFRIFKLTRFLTEMDFLTGALKASLRKITIFMLTVLMLIVVLGSIMYLVEHHENGFTSIPESIYWAVVTITTVGYGDISPATPLGKAVASFIMLLGYGILAVPTGILSAEIAAATRGKLLPAKTCQACFMPGQEMDAAYCKHCGSKL